MPTCKNPKCNAFFPTSIKEGTKKIVLNKRKYCFSCSPYGKRLGQALSYSLSNPTKPDHEAVCKTCNKQYSYARSNRKGASRTECASCKVNKRRFALKEKAVAYKGGCCALCGYTKCSQAIVFHHLDPSKKDFGISGNHTRAWVVVKEELDKCVALCQNCHVEVHAGVATVGSYHNGNDTGP